MTVHVLTWNYYDDYDVCGVFARLQDAEAKKMWLSDKPRYCGGWFTITTMEVDDGS